MTSPAENGIGAQLCMRAAIEQSGLNPEQIGYINAHATSTPLGKIALPYLSIADINPRRGSH